MELNGAGDEARRESNAVTDRRRGEAAARGSRPPLGQHRVDLTTSDLILARPGRTASNYFSDPRRMHLPVGGEMEAVVRVQQFTGRPRLPRRTRPP